jgi:hypothetical protein
MKAFNPPRTAPRRVSWITASVALVVLGFCDAAYAIEVRFLPINEEVSGRKIGIMVGKRLIELKDLNPKKRSKNYTLSGSPAPALVALDRERPNGNPASAEIVFPTGITSPLVLIFADSSHASGMRTLVLEDSEAGFPWGTLRFVNTADKAWLLRCEKSTLTVRDPFAVVDVSPGGIARNIGVQLAGESTPDQALYSAVWEHDPKQRKLVFIVPSADALSTEVTLEIIPQDQRANP